MAQPEVLEAPPTRTEVGGARGDQESARPRRRRRAGDRPHEAARRVPRHRRAARPRRACSDCACSGRRTHASSGSARSSSARPPYQALEAYADRPAAGARRARSRHTRRDRRTPAGRPSRGDGSGSCADLEVAARALTGRARRRRADVRLRPAARRRARARADPARLPQGRPCARRDHQARQERRHGLQGPAVPGGRDQRRRRPLHARAATSRRRTSNETAALIAANRSAYTSSRNLFLAVGAASVAPRARSRPDPLVVACRPDPAHRGAAGGDRRGRLLRPPRRAEPGRARRARRQREPDERRAAAAVRRARDGEPPQERVPREHVARAANAAERDHRLLAGAAPAAVRRDQREAGGVPRRHPLVGQPPALADQRRARPVEGRGRPGRARGRRLLAARGARARCRDGA